jgi:hypothetical protein
VRSTTQQRADDPPRARTIGLVMFAIDRRGGPMLLTDRVCVARIAKRLYIGGANFEWKYPCGRTPCVERIIDDRFRGCRQDPLGSAWG